MAAPTMNPGVFSTTTFNALAAYVDATRTGLAVRGKRTTSSSTTTTEVGVLRVDGIPLTAGHVYRVSSGTLLLDTSTNNDAVDARIRYDNTGASATTSSTTMPGALFRVRLADNAVAESGIIVCTYTPASNETLSILLTVGRFSGAGNENIFGDGTATIEIFCEDYGTDSGNVGISI